MNLPKEDDKWYNDFLVLNVAVRKIKRFDVRKTV